jgi:hypothetical protein
MEKLFIGVQYNHADRSAQLWSLNKYKVRNALILYNDNIHEWLTGSYTKGKGNRKLRPLRNDGNDNRNINNNNFVLGIPISNKSLDTIENVIVDNKEYKLTHKEIIILAMNNIDKVIKDNNINIVYWNVTDRNTLQYATPLGTPTYTKPFNPSQETVDFINNNINNIISSNGFKKILQEELTDKTIHPVVYKTSRNIIHAPDVIKNYVKQKEKTYYGYIFLLIFILFVIGLTIYYLKIK